MTNVECRKNDEAQMTNDPFAATRIFSDLVIPSFLRDPSLVLRHSQHVTQLRLFGLKVFYVVRICLGTDRHLLDHFETISLQAHNFLRVVSQKPELPHA